MTPITPASRIAPLLPASRPGERSVGRSGGLVAAASEVRTPTVAVTPPTAPPAVRPGAAPRYGVAAYLAAGRLVADRAGGADGRGDVRLELSARVLADGGRVSVARRLESGRAVGIEAVVG